MVSEFHLLQGEKSESLFGFFQNNSDNFFNVLSYIKATKSLLNVKHD